MNECCGSPAIPLISALPSPIQTFASRGFRSVRTTSRRSLKARSRVVLRSQAVKGSEVSFVDGSTGDYDAIICATGYDLDIPYLDRDLRSALGPGCVLYQRTLHPDLPGLGVIGQFLAQGPYFPLLELQARWIVATWTGQVALPDEAKMRATIAQGQPPLDAHNALALTLAEELGVAPNVEDWPELSEALIFGPLLPPRYRLSGPGAMHGAADLFAEQLAASPRAPVDPADLEALSTFGLAGALRSHRR